MRLPIALSVLSATILPACPGEGTSSGDKEVNLVELVPHVTVVGTQTGLTNISTPMAPVRLTLTHDPGTPSARVVMQQAGIQRLQRHSLEVTREGLPLEESYMFATITRPISQVTGDEYPKTFSVFSDESGWVGDNRGVFYAADVDTRELGAALTDTAEIPGVFFAGATFLARIELNDATVPNDAPGTDDDLNGVLLGLQEGARSLATDIQSKVVNNWGSQPFRVSLSGVDFSPHDDGRKAVVYVFRFNATKPGSSSTIYVPVSFVFGPNAAGDGYEVSVNPTDITNKARLQVVLDEGWASDGTALLDAARDAYSDLDAATYQLATERMQAAIDAARPPGTAVPADFDVILTPKGSGGRTDASRELFLRILE